MTLKSQSPDGRSKFGRRETAGQVSPQSFFDNLMTVFFTSTPLTSNGSFSLQLLISDRNEGPQTQNAAWIVLLTLTLQPYSDP